MSGLAIGLGIGFAFAGAVGGYALTFVDGFASLFPRAGKPLASENPHVNAFAGAAICGLIGLGAGGLISEQFDTTGSASLKKCRDQAKPGDTVIVDGNRCFIQVPPASKP